MKNSVRNSDVHRKISNKKKTVLSNTGPSSSENEELLLKNQTNKNKVRLIVKGNSEVLLPRYTRKLSASKLLNWTEKDWKDRWSHKFNKCIEVGLYSPSSSDKLLFAYLNEKKQILKSKYTFNESLSGSQIITYNFKKHFKKIDLNFLYKILHSFFKELESLISVPYVEMSPDSVKIRLFYYVLPSITKKRIHQSLHRYIRSDEKLYKELILRRKFKSIMENIKLKIFISKLKEVRNFIVGVSPISFFKEFTFEDLYKIKSFDAFSNLFIHPVSYKLQPGFSDERGEIEITNSYGNNTPLNLLKLDFFKLTQQHDLLKSFFGLMFINKSQSILLNQSDRELFLASLHTSLLKEIKKEHEAKLKVTKYNKDISLFFNKKNLSILEDKYSPNDLMSSSVSDNTPNKFRPEVRNSKAPDIHSKEFSAISKYKNIEETKIVNSTNPQTNEEIITAFSLFNASEKITKFNEKNRPTIVTLNKEKFKYLICLLEKLFKKTILLELVKLKYPYHESNILAQVLGLSSKNKNFRTLMIKLLYIANISNPTNKILKQNISMIPSHLSGLKVRLAGRLLTQRLVPRFTVQSFQIGSLARGKINFMNKSRITLKNKRGAFSFTVITSHIFNK